MAGEPIEKQLSDLVFHVAGRLRWGFNAAAAELDLPPMQAMALANLRSPAPMRDLAEWLHCDASNVTGIVDGLERRGLVTRQSSPSDRRVKHLVLTEEGERRRDLLHARSAQNARAVFGLPDADREQLRDLLARLLDTGADHGCH
ncbi:MarR family winged helix-turn-helix transcriptional regulator [Dactylosporangium aurantiacum]|nr:MarR family transcriptional regulator [Dactylosporangium aurantiacum]MDG6109143.1 MarR family transcriptional regulator [Dactylosporangium aurantiacum]